MRKNVINLWCFPSVSTKFVVFNSIPFFSSFLLYSRCWKLNFMCLYRNIFSIFIASFINLFHCLPLFPFFTPHCHRQYDIESWKNVRIVPFFLSLFHTHLIIIIVILLTPLSFPIFFFVPLFYFLSFTFLIYILMVSCHKIFHVDDEVRGDGWHFSKHT